MTSTAPATTTAKPARQQIYKAVGINLSVSRVRTRIDKSNVNVDVENAVSNLKACRTAAASGGAALAEGKQTKAMVARAYSEVYDERKKTYDTHLAKLKASKDKADAIKLKNLPPFPVRTNTLDEKIEFVSKLRCRFSNNASVVLSSGLDYVTQELVQLAMINARKVGKAIITVDHMVGDGFTGLDVYPLVCNLPVVKAAMAKNEPAGDANEAVEAEQVEDHTGSSFEFYVNIICKAVKSRLVAKNETFTPIRISKPIRKFCSDIVIELINRMSPLVKLYAGTSKLKTVNDAVIQFVFKFLLMDAGIDTTKFDAFVANHLTKFAALKAKADAESKA
jgi:hypothetical protein